MPKKQRATEGVAQSVALAGGTGRALDEVTQKPILIDFVHHEVHDGNTFQASQKTADASPIADDGTYEMLIVVGNEAEAHLVFDGAMGGTAEFAFFEGTTVSARGAKLLSANMRRSKATTNIATVEVYEEPTVTVDGTLLACRLLPGGAGPGQSRTGSVGREDTEWVLNPNTMYLVRLTNRAGNVQPSSILAQWYEKIPED